MRASVRWTAPRRTVAPTPSCCVTTWRYHSRIHHRAIGLVRRRRNAVVIAAAGLDPDVGSAAVHKTGRAARRRVGVHRAHGGGVYGCAHRGGLMVWARRRSTSFRAWHQWQPCCLSSRRRSCRCVHVPAPWPPLSCLLHDPAVQVFAIMRCSLGAGLAMLVHAHTLAPVLALAAQRDRLLASRAADTVAAIIAVQTCGLHFDVRR